ncbi:hypothetical protein [Paraburkholderia azotifigens]|uniref:Uncharacterized protein n=1 Tax=Paraburkholderia azotifigens TaxID=2057004 RepID=A0A5C6VFX9_9BURK|nr:hypothetical protein [Paraburkholderia azotifigens]TXC82288.1 hypothetical protein FRZ40_17490 [Paraburkholderia azotifigens]
MPCCPLTHTVHARPAQRDDARPFDLRRTLYTFAMGIAAGLGWHRLEQLLSAIPDSNDDFMIF